MAETSRARRTNSEEIARALRDVFISPNESDRNLEPANVVDGAHRIAEGLHDIAVAIRGLTQVLRERESDA